MLILDGEIIAAAQEERFTRKNMTPDFRAAISYCLKVPAFCNQIDNGHEKPKFEGYELLAAPAH